MPVIKLRPALKDYLWGGTRLADDFAKAPRGTRIAESWELSAHPAGASTVAATGAPFPALLDTLTQQQLGLAYRRGEPFPILIKLIDAAQPLSIQVHPNDEQARQTGNSAGKTEFWHIVDAADGAFLYRGLKPGVTRADFTRALGDGTVCDLLVRYDVRTGETYFIPAGTVHAIGAGCLICEVQQNADITYRVFDYNRVDADGNPRPLHTEQALAVMDFSGAPPSDGSPATTPFGTVLCDCAYFRSILLDSAKTASIEIDPNSFVSLVALRGGGLLENGGIVCPVAAGDSFFITADSGTVRLSGTFEAVLTTLAQPTTSERVETSC